jgi:putative membrane protein
MNRPHKPAVFRLDDPGVVVTPVEEPRAAVPPATNLPATEAGLPPVTPPRSRSGSPLASRSFLESVGARRSIPWAGLFWVSAGGLTLLATGLGIANLIADLFNRSALLGGAGAVLAAVAAAALAVIATREAFGLARLGTIDAMREAAAAILESDDRTAGRALGRDLIALTKRMPHLARGRARLEIHLGDIIDGADLVRLSERELMTPLDEEARRLIAAAARRVSVVTALSPRAAVDMFFVLVTALGLMRRLALLYGARPGMLGLMKLMRYAITHIALTGGMAASDSLIQQMIGHGLAAKLSAKLGEGVLNGLLTARLGLAAMDATRPLPFTALRRPALNDLAMALLKGSDGREAEGALQDQRQ